MMRKLVFLPLVLTALLGVVLAQDDVCDAPACVVYVANSPYTCVRSLYDCGSCILSSSSGSQYICSTALDCSRGTLCTSDNPLFPMLTPRPTSLTPPLTTSQRPATTTTTTTIAPTPPPTTTIIPTVTPTTTTVPASTTSTPASSPSNMTAIAVGVSCSIAVVVAAGGLFFLWKRKQASRKMEAKDMETLNRDEYDGGELHADAALFNTFGHRSLAMSSTSEPDAMWWNAPPSQASPQKSHASSAM
ncbi:hypothetical protein LEN26_008906 [Aphanomyces euteiches]|nr:hypothetical protein AeMF1_004696 [Aphanomyces euteiches]KAH9130048.1 hypothetical protein LEN26_008906 [Aphanomyces euteiches]KAH9185756.1 hypothetical protein AeNC1_012269 [Aphanomyces euteiches]